MGKFLTRVWARYLVLGCMTSGLILFVAPLYWLAFKEDEQFMLRRYMPVGGVSMMLGFLAIAIL